MKKIKYLMPILGVSTIAASTIPLVGCGLFDDETVTIEATNLRLENNKITIGAESFSTKIEFLGTGLVMTNVAIYVNGTGFYKFTFEKLTSDPDYDAKVTINNLSTIHSGSRIEFIPICRNPQVFEPENKVFVGDDNIETASKIEDFKNTAELDGFSVEDVTIGGIPHATVINTDDGRPLGNISVELVEKSSTLNTISFGIKLTFSQQTINSGTYHLLLNLFDEKGENILTSDKYTVTYKPKLLAYTPNGYIWGEDPNYQSAPLAFSGAAILGYSAVCPLTFVYLHELESGLYIRFWRNDAQAFNADNSYSMPPVIYEHSVTGVNFSFTYDEYPWLCTLSASFNTLVPVGFDSAKDHMGIYWDWDEEYSQQDMLDHELISPGTPLNDNKTIEVQISPL